MSVSLILLVCLLLATVVLLFAFAGCGLDIVGVARDPYQDTVANAGGLVSYWRLDEAQGAETARDGGPQGTDGRYQGGPRVGAGALVARDSTDTAPRFDGIATFVDIPVGAAPHPLLPPSISLEAWMSPAVDPPGDASDVDTLFDSLEAPDDDTVRGFGLRVTREAGSPSIEGRGGLGTPGASFEDRTALVSIALPHAVLGGTWAHVVLTYDAVGRQLSLYLSHLDPSTGRPTTSTDSAADVRCVNAQAGPLGIGAGRTTEGNPTNFFSGGIDEVALYNVALTEGTVKEHFALGLA